MEIYVQSCGLAPEHDYRWWKISQDLQSKEIPPILKNKINTKVYLTDLYESHDPSIVLAKDGSQLLLLVTALKAIKRSKDYGRGIRNSVAFIGEYPEYEPVLRIIAANALEEWESFRHKIDEAVEFDQNLGFKVDFDSIKNYVEDVKNKVKDGVFEKPDLTRKIANNNVLKKNELAQELRKFCLPKDWKGPLVIVTGNASENVLTQNFVWRSVSERVLQDKSENWKEIKDVNKKIIVILFLGIAGIALLIILNWPPSTKLQPIQPPETKPLESKQSQLHQETLETQIPTEANSSSNSSSTDTTEPNATGDIPPNNQTEITANTARISKN
ncbi:MAG: hypothetical protein DSM106950_36075 [Stigonema ocellatum SAG 48.90 = DSM 106950]|nr:hypothetical protein [Stigonema ocellatum SAG 48.90 = DSM 106950]